MALQSEGWRWKERKVNRSDAGIQQLSWQGMSAVVPSLLLAGQTVLLLRFSGEALGSH